MPKLLSITECADRHGVRRTTIHAAIQRGALPATKVGHTWVIAEADCTAYRPLRDPHEKGKRGAGVRWGAPRGARSALPGGALPDG